MPYAHKDLQHWQALWIMSNEQIYCSECTAQQPSKLSNIDFIHSADCSRAGPHQRPWEDLMCLLIIPAVEEAHA